jgi:CBS domain containing-hemolysin-like protein
LTAGGVLLATGFAVLFVANAMRAALPELILDLGRDPSERRRAAAVNLRILWFSRFAALLSCGAGAFLAALSPSVRAVLPGWVATALALVLVLLLGELLPSRLGHTKPSSIVRIFRIPFLALRILFYVPVRLLLGKADPDNPASEWAFTPPDFFWLEQRYEKADGEDLGQERELMEGIVDFSDKIVREVMVPRIDMVSMDLRDDLDAVVQEVLKAGHSRIPVYRERIDDIAGVLYVKDLLRFLAGDRAGDFRMEKVLRQAYFVPEYKRIDDLFREFQTHRIHMAIVVDEYGGTAGLVTMEDIVEEVFGEILDEFDDSEAPRIQSLALGAYRIDAMLPIDDLNELLGSSLEESDVETAGGLVYSALGHIPRPGEQVFLGGFAFTVEKVRGQRILLLKVAPETGGERAENS